MGMPLLLVGASLLETEPVHLILHAARADDAGLAALLREARRVHLPQMLVLRVAEPEARAHFAPRHPMIDHLPEAPARAMAYLCEGSTCQLPVSEPEELGRMLAGLAAAGRGAKSAG